MNGLIGLRRGAFAHHAFDARPRLQVQLTPGDEFCDRGLSISRRAHRDDRAVGRIGGKRESPIPGADGGDNLRRRWRIDRDLLAHGRKKNPPARQGPAIGAAEQASDLGRPGGSGWRSGHWGGGRGSSRHCFRSRDAPVLHEPGASPAHAGDRYACGNDFATE
jgi:hypothetical protein